MISEDKYWADPVSILTDVLLFQFERHKLHGMCPEPRGLKDTSCVGCARNPAGATKV